MEKSDKLDIVHGQKKVFGNMFSFLIKYFNNWSYRHILTETISAQKIICYANESK